MMSRLIVMVFLISILLVQSGAENIPPNIRTFTDDYFTAYGSPEMIVSIAGSPEYDKDETSNLLVRIMNQGKITGFESEDTPVGSNEIALSKIEQQQEYGITTAVGVVASISAGDAPVDIKTPPLSAGTLESGQVSQPLSFEIKIWDNAPAGKYTMEVNLTYQFQKDVQVDGNASNNQVDYNMLYQHVNETHEIFIIIKEQADFEAIEVTSDLLPGKPGILSITFHNTGEETASRASARLRLSDPLSSTDYTAFLGPKAYSVKAEIEYEDAEGHTRISDIIYVPAQVRDQEEGKGIFGNPYLLGAGLIVIAVLIFIYLKRQKGGSGSEH